MIAGVWFYDGYEKISTFTGIQMIAWLKEMSFGSAKVVPLTDGAPELER